MAARLCWIPLVLSVASLATAEQAELHWDVRVAEERPLHGLPGEYRRILFSHTSRNEQFEVHAVRIPNSEYRAAIADQPVQGDAAPSVATIAKRTGSVIAVNGGYFTKEFAPSGLCIIDEKSVSPISAASPLSGILWIGGAGKIHLTPRGIALPEVAYALQAGPFLIDPGGKLGIRSEDGKAARRTVVGLTGDQELLLLSSSTTTLRSLARVMHGHAEAFGVDRFDRALNLDGGPSSAMYVRYAEEPVTVEESWPVRNVLLVQGRKEGDRGRFGRKNFSNR